MLWKKENRLGSCVAQRGGGSLGCWLYQCNVLLKSWLWALCLAYTFVQFFIPIKNCLFVSLLSSTVLPDHPDAGLEDERCPLLTGCDRAGGQCVCDTRRSCLGSFTYPNQETCLKASKSGNPSISASFYVIIHICLDQRAESRLDYSMVFIRRWANPKQMWL